MHLFRAGTVYEQSSFSKNSCTFVFASLALKRTPFPCPYSPLPVFPYPPFPFLPFPLPLPPLNSPFPHTKHAGKAMSIACYQQINLNSTWCISSNFESCPRWSAYLFCPVNFSSVQLAKGRFRALSFAKTSSISKLTFWVHCVPLSSIRCASLKVPSRTSYRSGIEITVGEGAAVKMPIKRSRRRVQVNLFTMVKTRFSFRCAPVWKKK